MNLTEVARNNYLYWGIIDHRGNIITGEDHPTARIHGDLNKKVPDKHRHATVEYAYSDKGPDLMIRTASRDGIINAMKHIKRLEQLGHPIETITHDHCDNLAGVHHYGESVRKERALIQLNRILNQY